MPLKHKKDLLQKESLNEVKFFTQCTFITTFFLILPRIFFTILVKMVFFFFFLILFILCPQQFLHWKLVWCGQPIPLGQPQITKAGATRTTTGKYFEVKWNWICASFNKISCCNFVLKIQELKFLVTIWVVLIPSNYFITAKWDFC